MSHLSILGAAFVALLLGARHGLDWDHLAAITDLVGTAGRRSRTCLALAVFYCAGHGLVIVLLGVMVGMVGVHLPGGFDRAFEVVVGATLIVLGLLVLWQVWRERQAYRLTGRWQLLIGLLRRAWLRRRGGEVEWDAAAPVSKRAAFGIGVLHGTGAETPTQMVLFASAAAAGFAGSVWLVLLAFAVGLVVCDLAVAGLWLGGRLGAVRVPGGQVTLGLVTGLASLTVGIAFVMQKSSWLPALFGG